MLLYLNMLVLLVEFEVALIGTGREVEDVEDLYILGVEAKQEHEIVVLEVVHLQFLNGVLHVVVEFVLLCFVEGVIQLF